MNKTYRENLNMWTLDTDADHILHEIGKDCYPVIRHTTVRDPGLWEEIPVTDIPPYTKAEYDAKVNELVRQRYSESEEFALQRKMLNVILSPQPLMADTDGDATELTDSARASEEYAAYNAYVNQCKADAPAAILDDKAREKAEQEQENTLSE